MTLGELDLQAYVLTPPLKELLVELRVAIQLVGYQLEGALVQIL